MSPTSEIANVASVDPTHSLSDEVVALLRFVPILASLKDSELHCIDGAEEVHLATGDWLVKQGEPVHSFWILLEGSLKLWRTGPDGRELALPTIPRGSALGETQILANMPSVANLAAFEPCHLLKLTEDQFWSLMTSCIGVRKAILGNMAERLEKMQNVTLQQEKMAALGVMAAGLMHELNNPGAAARRAASQLRENLSRMHQLAARFTKADLTHEQKECLLELQTHAMAADRTLRMNSLEQSDAEERLAEWMESAQVDRAWQIAPTLVSVGIASAELECAHSYFPGQIFSDALGWLEAIVSSQQLVGTIEESIGRVGDLVHAVKSYAYEGKGQRQSIDFNDSIHATVVMLAHKMREKQLAVEKSFGKNLPLLQSGCSGLNQIWTNLIDNAIDAAPQGGRLALRTWSEDLQPDSGKPRVDLCFSLTDNGAGIPPECQAQIFDPFFTTKPVGVGTGLGLGIVYRIVEQYGGTIHFSSEPGRTEFVVRIPTPVA